MSLPVLKKKKKKKKKKGLDILIQDAQTFRESKFISRND